MALEGESKPDRLATVFAGQEVEATAQARGHFADIPPSSPSIALFKDGELVYFVPRHRIEGRTAEDVAGSCRGVRARSRRRRRLTAYAMGTFHHNKSELHGITVVVETDDGEVFVGRCDDMDEQRVILLDVDVHRDGDDGRSTDEYLDRAARFGVWKKHDRLVIPRVRGSGKAGSGEL